LSYVGAWFVALISNIVIPVPEEVILLAFGYLAGTGHINVLIIIPIFISGLLISDIVVYRLSRSGSKFINWIYQKFFSKRMLNRSDEWFSAHINKIIFFSRFLIQLRFLGPFIAGQKKIPQKTFIKYDLLALVIYVPMYIFLGLFFQSRVEGIINNVGVIKNIILVIVGILLAIALFKYIYKFLFNIKK
jgi:membrane protein DedA with SNARE-associated domain